RVCMALDYPAFRARGWHSPGVAGALGAAAAAGRLLGLDASRITGCLGLAGAQAAGTFAAMGTVAVKFHQANGARAGLSAALYAAGGFAGSPQILSAADGGILSTYSGGGSAGRAVAGLGQSWELRAISMRSYPAASTLQALVDCLLSADAQAAQRAGQVTSVLVWLPPHAYRLGHGGWGSQLAAMQSARFVTAVALRQGSCWLDSFGPQQRGDETITCFAAQRVDVRADEQLAEGAVRVLLRGPAGDLELGRDYPHGDSRDPLAAAEVEAKAARCLAASLPAGRAGAAAAALTGLGTAPAITTFGQAVTG
ncbi:MAG: MmgE/PrpD family protein, partial [Streptosporangiaceae bacterium]